MKFPFVSRGRYEEACRIGDIHSATADSYKHQFGNLLVRYDELVKLVVTPPQREPLPTLPVDLGLPQEILLAISERAPRGTAAHAQVESAAYEMLDAGLQEDEVVQAIMNGERAPV